jgi:outer membrane receptor protein involved in Fe transport
MRFLILVLLYLPFAASSTHVIEGVVFDPSGSGVPDTIVQLRADSGESFRVARTDGTGGFRFENVNPGGYQLIIERVGFKVSNTPVQIGSRPVNRVRIELLLADLRQRLTVEDTSGAVNATAGDNLDIVRLDRRTIEALPTLGTDVLATAARFLDPASAGINGPSVVVDGMETSEKGVTASAIQEIRINQNPYSAEYARQGKSRIEIITSPGQASYHGTAVFLLRDYHLDARNALAPEKPSDHRRVYEGTFTGPLGDGRKTSFLVSAIYQDLDLVSIIFAKTLAGAARQVFPTPGQDAFVSSRINHQLTPNNQISIRYEFTDVVFNGEGAGGLTLPEAAYRQTNREHHLYYQQRSVITPRLLNEFQARMGQHNMLLQSDDPLSAKIVVVGAFTGGGAQADTRVTENHLQFHEMVTWSARQHVVKFGMTSPDLSRRGRSDHSNFGGTYSFSSLDDYRLRRPFSYTRQQGDGYLAIWQREIGVFLQDDWRVRRNLSLGLGLRWDWQNYLGDYNNIAPRLSLAYAPGRQRRFVFRGGAGIFYDRTGWLPMGDVERYDGVRLREITLVNPAFPAPPLIAGQPATVARFAPGIRSPYALQYSGSVETQLSKSATISVGYVGMRGAKYFRSRDVNAPVVPSRIRPDSRYGVLRQFESSADQRANSLDVTVRGKVTKYFTGTAQYQFGRIWNDTNGIYSLPAYSWNPAGEWARADYDQRHRFNLAGALRAGPWVNLGVLFSAYSGNPYSITTGRDDNFDAQALDRPVGVPRNSETGPEQATLDLRWFKDFALSGIKKDKGPSLQVGLDAFNALNHVNYVSYVGVQTSPFFGQPVAARPARRVQMGLRFRF